MLTIRGYWPRGRDYGFAWLLTIAIYFVLTGWRGPNQSLLLTDALPSSVSGRCTVAVLLFALNGLLFWGHVRLQFLTWRTAVVPVAVTYCGLTISYLAFWAAMAVLRGRVTVSLMHPDPLLTTAEVGNAVAGMTAALFVSSIWKTEDAGVSNARLERQTALDVLKSYPNIEERDFKRAVDAIVSLRESLAALESRLPRQADREVAGRWRQAATELATLFRDYALDQVRTITDNVRRVEEATRALDQETPA